MGVKLNIDPDADVAPVGISSTTISQSVVAAAASASAAATSEANALTYRNAAQTAQMNAETAEANAEAAAATALANAAAAALKVPVRIAVTSNISLSGTSTIQGVALQVGDRVLAAGQTTGSANGIYVVAAGAWSRAADADTSVEIDGATVLVRGGDYAGYIFRLVTEGVVLGTTPLYWMESENIPNARATHWYVDSVNGSDSNTGARGSAFATIAKLMTVAKPGDSIWLRRNSVFREQFGLLDRWKVRAYGHFGKKPKICGADLLANASFSLESGDVYKISLPSIPTTNNPYAGVNANGVLMVWENDARLGESLVLRTSIADVQSHVGSFWWDSTNKILYVHASDSSDITANGKVYEASTRTLCIHGGDKVYVENLIGEKAGIVTSGGQQAYAILGYGSGKYVRCEGNHCWNHCVGVANSVTADDLIFDRCQAYDAERNTITAPPTLFIAYKAGTQPSRVIFKNCRAKQPILFTGSYQEVAFYSHGATCICEYQGRNYAENIYYGVQLINDGTDGSFNICNGKFAGNKLGIGVYITYGTHNIEVELANCSSTAVVFTNPSASISPDGSRVTGKIIDCLVGLSINAVSGASIRVYAHDLLIARKTSPGSHVDGTGIQSNATGIFDMHKCVFHNIGTNIVGNAANNPVGVSDYNVFSGHVRMYSGTNLTPTFSTLLSDWQSQTGQDANSVTTTPVFNYRDLEVAEAFV
jgi:hypothetical protein